MMIMTFVLYHDPLHTASVYLYHILLYFSVCLWSALCNVRIYHIA